MSIAGPHDDALQGDELAGAVAGLAEPNTDSKTRAKLLVRMVRGLRLRGAKAPRKAIGWLVDTVTDIAPRIPIRNLETLRAHFPELDDAQLAERLVRNAARATAGVGAVGGGIASIEWAAPPTLLSAPVLLTVETVAVVAIELKLIGELHEVYGHPIRGGPMERTVDLLQAWATHRGVNPIVPGTAVATVLGSATRKRLRDMLVRRFGRNLTTLGPFLTGAAVASFLNHRGTRRLGDEVGRDLRLKFGPLALPQSPPGGAS